MLTTLASLKKEYLRRTGIALSALLLSACSCLQPKAVLTLTSEQSQCKLVFNESGIGALKSVHKGRSDVMLFCPDKEGNLVRVEPCKLPREGQEDQSGVCKALQNVSVNDFVTISVMETFSSPGCGTIFINGTPHPWPPGCK